MATVNPVHSSLFLLVISLLCLTLCTSLPPPSCISNYNHPKGIPLTLNQLSHSYLNNMFSGFNLNFAIQDKPDFVDISNKIQTLSQNMEFQHKNIKSYKFAHSQQNSNKWSKYITILQQKQGATTLWWGTQESPDQVPIITQSLRIQRNPILHCFDSVYIPSNKNIIVDCMYNDSPIPLNLFIFVDTVSKTVVTDYKNDMYAPYQSVTNRQIYATFNSNYLYLIRVYLADGVDVANKDNTYIQILSINDHNFYKPSTLLIIDRSYLSSKTLSIMDFRMYNNKFYLLNTKTNKKSELIQLQLNQIQQVLIQNTYQINKQCYKFNIYENRYIQDDYIGVFVTQNNIYEISLGNNNQGKIIKKYVLEDNILFTQIWINQQFIVGHIVATKGTVQQKVTVVFDRKVNYGLYDAATVIQHSSTQPNQLINLQQQSNNLLIISPSSSLKLYRIARSTISINPIKKQLLNQQITLNIIAKSQQASASIMCQFVYKISVVQINKIDIWYNQDVEISQLYHANYPEELEVMLKGNNGVLGANITWKIQQQQKSSLLYENRNKANYDNWIHKQNITNIQWLDAAPQLNTKLNLLKIQHISFIQHQQHIYIYIQNSQNQSYVCQCREYLSKNSIQCSTQRISFLSNKNKLTNFITTQLNIAQTNKYYHLVAITTAQANNQVSIYDLITRKQAIQPIIFQQQQLTSQYDGMITDLQFNKQYLIVTLKYIKSIYIYDIRKCIDEDNGNNKCQQIIKIDHTTMQQLGVKSFQPNNIVTSAQHPSVLFIQNLQQILIVSFTYDNNNNNNNDKYRIMLLATIQYPTTDITINNNNNNTNWQMTITKNNILSLISAPSNIYQYDISQIFTRINSVKLLRKLPLYNYQIIQSGLQQQQLVIQQQNGDIAATQTLVRYSNKGNLVYIVAIQNNNDYNNGQQQQEILLIYNTDRSSVTSLYDTYILQNNNKTIQQQQYQLSQSLLISVASSPVKQTDYILIFNNDNLILIKQYYQPKFILNIPNTTQYKFNIVYTNNQQKQKQQSQIKQQIKQQYKLNSKIIISNLPSKLQPSSQLLNNTKIITQQILYKKYQTQTQQVIKLQSDAEWFNGHVVNYTIAGQNQHQNIKIKNHVQMIINPNKDKFNTYDVYDYINTVYNDVNYLQGYSHIAQLYNNGTISRYIIIPTSNRGQVCTKIAYDNLNNLLVTACQDSYNVNLYVTILNAFKPMVLGPYILQDILSVSTMQIQQQLILILDTQQPYSNQFTIGIYAISSQNQQQQPLIIQLMTIQYVDLISIVLNNNNNNNKYTSSPYTQQLCISDAKIMFNSYNTKHNLYKLFIVQCNKGIIVLDLQLTTTVDKDNNNYYKKLKITNSGTFIPVVQQLQKNKYTIPSNSKLDHLTIIQQQFTSQYLGIQILLSVTDFHIFQIKYQFKNNNNGNNGNQQPFEISSQFSNVYYRYGFYQNYGEIKIYSTVKWTYFGIIQKIPIQYEVMKKYSKKIFAIYKVNNNIKSGDTSINVNYMFGEISLSDSRMVSFDFNHPTFNGNNVLNATIFQTGKYSLAALNTNLQIILQPHLKEGQHPYLQANNDFDKYQIDFRIPMLKYQKAKSKKNGYYIKKVVTDGQAKSIDQEIVRMNSLSK